MIDYRGKVAADQHIVFIHIIKAGLVYTPGLKYVPAIAAG